MEKVITVPQAEKARDRGNSATLQQGPYMTFDDFELDPRIKRAVQHLGFTKPTPIQEQLIPVALQGKDAIGIAQTGTGKTLAFGLPSLSRMAQAAPRPASILILTPTRELCHQCYDVLSDISKAVKMNCVAVYGGVGMHQQRDDIADGAELIVATPGRLLDHMRRRWLDFKNLEVLIMDEADRMLDMGFLPDINDICRQLPRDRQTLMCSATWPDEIQRLVNRFMRDPEHISVGAISKPVDKVRQELYAVHPQDKQELLIRILEESQIDSAVIFMRTKTRAMSVARALQRKGFKATEIHGDRSQIQRKQALDGFKSGKFSILVATDVASRGLDVDGISHVINYDIPLNADDYIHRIGRTARAEKDGDAITFVSPQEHEPLSNIERSLGRNLPRAEWERSAPVLSTYKGAAASAGAGGRRGSVKGRRGLVRRPSSPLARR